MPKTIYTVHQAGSEWTISEGGKAYGGYKSEAGAIKAAVAVASKLGLNGNETFVVLQKADGTSKPIFASDPEPPTIDSMMDAER
ncbi:hypothetical protein [Roseomonas harenae]|uniref:hypothetical protein n=1 Tax=Muricoccus harenae TaxID=2692566 RepID=UPI00133134A8|nr:hypothetical protein [Roseomonas harenae]